MKKVELARSHTKERVRTTAFYHEDGPLKAGGREEIQKLLGEGQLSKSETKPGGRAWK